VLNKRREFLNKVVALAGLLPVAWATRSWAQNPKPPKKVDLKTNAMAKNINYKEKIDLKKDKNLVNADGSPKACYSCLLYEPLPAGTAPEKSKEGVCKLMAALEDRIVLAQGGCTSWAPNAAVKGKKYGG
jgi:hypothetical protein